MRELTEMEMRVVSVIDQDVLRASVFGEASVIGIARAVIRAMREPTESMLAFGENRRHRREDWQTMIDAASPEIKE